MAMHSSLGAAKNSPGKRKGFPNATSFEERPSRSSLEEFRKASKVQGKLSYHSEGEPRVFNEVFRVRFTLLTMPWA